MVRRLAARAPYIFRRRQDPVVTALLNEQFDTYGVGFLQTQSAGVWSRGGGLDLLGVDNNNGGFVSGVTSTAFQGYIYQGPVRWRGDMDFTITVEYELPTAPADNIGLCQIFPTTDENTSPLSPITNINSFNLRPNTTPALSTIEFTDRLNVTSVLHTGNITGQRTAQIECIVTAVGGGGFVTYDINYDIAGFQGSLVGEQESYSNIVTFDAVVMWLLRPRTGQQTDYRINSVIVQGTSV